jgi:ABC-type antimicrobial peptide transport system permease subunit
VNDLIAQILFLLSAFGTIVIMVLIIVKETHEQKTVDNNGAKNHVKRTCTNESGRFYID